jgi:hypothetical protein
MDRSIDLSCTITGIRFGTLIIHSEIQGAQPYVTKFQENLILHPIFSLSLPKALALFRNSLERSLEGKDIDDYLEVSFVALLKGMNCLTIPVVHNPIIPTRTNVHSNGHKLITIVKWHISRPSFVFPKLNLSTLNNNEKLENIQDYLTLLTDLIMSADRKKVVFDEEERANLQANAISSIRRPEKIAKKSLWRWCENHLAHSQWKSETIKLHRLFFATGKDVTRLDREDLEFLLNALEATLPLGTPLLHEVRKHCEGLLTQWEDHFKDFSVVDTVAAIWNAMPEATILPSYKPAVTIRVDASNKPREEDYPTRASFIVAMARFKLNS